MFGSLSGKKAAAGSRLRHSFPDVTGTVLSSVRKASKVSVRSST
jgi:hypothetical protein